MGERIGLPANAFGDGNATRMFESFISDAMNTLSGKSLPLLFDEYELIETKIDDGILRSGSDDGTAFDNKTNLCYKISLETIKPKYPINICEIPDFGLIPLPVTIEIYDRANQQLFKQTQAEGETLIWHVPDGFDTAAPTQPKDFEGDVRIMARQTDRSGRVRRGEISASTRQLVREKTGDLPEGVLPRPVEQPAIKLTPKETISITGTLLAFDNRTPHSGVFVQAIRDGQVVAFAFSDDVGRYRFVNLKPGRYQVRCRIPSGDLYYESPLQVKRGKTISDVDFRFALFKKGTWRRFSSIDGLAENHTRAIYRDSRGYLWLGTRKGVSRYDGKTFVSYAQKDGLLYDSIEFIHKDQRGELWFGGGFYENRGGLSRYDGKIFVNYTQSDGLADVRVEMIGEDRHGTLWFGGGSTTIFAGGVSRFDPVGLVNFTTADGLFENGDYDALLRVVQEIDGRGMKLILLLDEFEVVTQNEKFDAKFYAFLRALANRYNVAYTTTSRRQLQELCHNKQISDSPFFKRPPVQTCLPCLRATHRQACSAQAGGRQVELTRNS